MEYLYRRNTVFEVLRAGRLHGWFVLGQDDRPTRWVVPRTEYEGLFATDLAGWTSFDGLELPTRMTQPELGRSFTWTAAEPNPALDDSLFRMR